MKALLGLSCPIQPIQVQKRTLEKCLATNVPQWRKELSEDGGQPQPKRCHSSFRGTEAPGSTSVEWMGEGELQWSLLPSVMRRRGCRAAGPVLTSDCTLRHVGSLKMTHAKAPTRNHNCTFWLWPDLSHVEASFLIDPAELEEQHSAARNSTGS